MGDDTNPNSVIEEIMESPEKLRDLDLDAFAEELERTGVYLCVVRACMCASVCICVCACMCACIFINVVCCIGKYYNCTIFYNM